MPFVWGLLSGVLAAMIVAGALGAWAYQRFVLLERRAQQAERLAEIGALTGGLRTRSRTRSRRFSSTCNCFRKTWRRKIRRIRGW